MAKRAAAVLAQAVRLPNGEYTALSDHDLIRRFVESGDQAAFAAVVRRHSGMVLGVCKRVLHSQADAEDATQAVFLVLAKKAKATRWKDSAANWLYTTARKVAHNARLSAARRAKREGAAAVPESVAPFDAMTGRELVAALDEELDKLSARYREPLVLCYLEGLTRDEAAGRLGLPEATLKSQLERGRKKLADALTARGCALGVALLATATTTSSAGASPPRLHDSILAAVGGHPSATAAALAQGVAVNGLWTNKLLLSAVVLVGVGLVGLGLPAVWAADPPAMKKDESAKVQPAKADGKPITVTGTVVGPDGQPAAGVSINTMKPGTSETDRPTVRELTKTAADGTFAVTLDPVPAGRPELRFLAAAKAGFAPDWVRVGEVGDAPVSLKLAADDVPVTGRITDLEGKAVPKAVVRVRTLATTPTGDLSRVWAEWPRTPYLALQLANKDLWEPWLGGLPESVTADTDGQFEIKGVGRGRLLGLMVEGAGIETAGLRVVTDPKFDPKAVEQPTRGTMPGGSFQPGPALYGPTFTHAGKATQPVVGTVTDSRTGKPVAGVMVNGSAGGPRWGENSVRATTDAAGKFALHGVAKADKVSLFVYPRPDEPYLPFRTTVAGRPGLTEIRADLTLVRGVRVKGRVVEKGSGKPVTGAGVHYTALADNKLHAALMGDRRGEGGAFQGTGPDGRFEMTVLPGAGIITAQGETGGRNSFIPYTQVRIAKADRPRADHAQLDNLGECFSAADGHIIILRSLSGYAIIEPKPTDDAVEVTITFDRGGTATGTVVDADGRPATGVTAYKLTACYDSPQKLTGGAFTVIALEADHPRTVLFVDEAKKLAAAVELKGGEKDVTVKLQPWGTLSGRLLDADGKPVAGATVTAVVKQSQHSKYMAFQAMVQGRTATTDAAGRFKLDVIGGEPEYHLGFSLKNKFLDTGFNPRAKGHAVKPGETTAVGDLKAKGE